MGIFGRSRANTTNGGISQPVLTFSDAAPRDDLQALGKLDSTMPRPYTAKHERQTGTATTSNGRGLRQKSQKNGIQAFDFTVTQPPEGPLVVDEPAGLNGGMDSHAIGIALGSPSMVPPPQYHPIEWSSPSSERQDPSTITTSNIVSLRRKPSKWKKFGGMLKGRQNDGKRTREGFYQLDINKSQDETVPVIQNPDYKQPIVSVAPQFNDRWEDQQKNPADSLLTVNIPTVEMERYSVMFRSVLGEKPSSNLLARRSRALNQLHVDGTEAGLHDPHKPQRRATSPSTNRSSTFTLFPGIPQNKIIVNGPDKPTPTGNEFAARSPIRSNTFPRATRIYNHDNNLAIPDLTPALSTGTFSGYSSAGYSSAEPSPIPFNAPATMARDYINPKKEPVWEMITTKKASSGSPEGVRASVDADASAKATSTPTMTTPLIPHEDHITHKVKQTATKPSIAMLPPRKASLPASADRAKLKVRNNNRIQEDNDPLLPVSENTASPTRDGPPPQLVRSQTMPLPLNITKKPSTQTQSTATTNTTPLLHPSPIRPSPSTDSLLANDTSFSQSSSQSPSPLIPQTIEISIARSVSVSRRIIPRQTLVPLGPNPHVFFHNENERYGELKAQKRVPVLIDVSPTSAADYDGSSSGGEESVGAGVRGSAGHRYQKSQDIVIESA